MKDPKDMTDEDKAHRCSWGSMVFDNQIFNYRCAVCGRPAPKESPDSFPKRMVFSHSPPPGGAK